MIDEEKRLQVIFSVIALAHEMREAGFPKTSYSKILREAIYFVWEIRAMSKHSALRLRSKAAEGLLPSELDYDHAVPMRIVIEILLGAWPDKDAVEHVLRNLVRGVLITKEEHKCLRKELLSSKMPDDWDGKDWAARYKEVGIEFSTLQGGDTA
jgi:hypothetical protein